MIFIMVSYVYKKDVSIRNIERIYKDHTPTSEIYLETAKNINNECLKINDVDND